MTALKTVLAAMAVMLATGASGLKPCCELEPPRSTLAAPVEPSERVQANYLLQAKRLHSYYDALSLALRTQAPNQLARLERPAPPAHGYRILPKIVQDAPPDCSVGVFLDRFRPDRMHQPQLEQRVQVGDDGEVDRWQERNSRECYLREG